MEDRILIRGLGFILLLIGLVLSANPELVSNKPIPNDTFNAVERRIWWGLFIGAGLLLQFHFQLTPWQATVSATLTSLLIGLLIARLIGIVLDGSVPKQWVNVAIELVMLVPLVWWAIKTRS
ncbi:DUF4345 family protein [Shewanella sp. 10N.286.52.A9]|uniref:DUF4345 family protein n=1 Tax=Shewanella sp. 10N.286.52.A9 TaxID=3229711 RepID=UPI00354E10BB